MACGANGSFPRCNKQSDGDVGLKLLFINGHLNTGGVEKSLVDILQHLDYSRYDVDVLLLEEEGDYASNLPPQVHVQLRCLKNTYGSLGQSLIRCVRQRDWFCFRMRLIFLLMKLFGQNKISLAKRMLTGDKHYDCAIGFRRGICTRIASFAVDADRCLSWWHHGTVNVEAEPYLYEVSNCQKIAVVSDAVKQMLTVEIPQLASKLVTIPNMLDVERAQAQAIAFNPYVKKNALHIVSVGGLVPEKHFQNAIQAAKQLKGKDISFQWHLIGDGVLHKQLQQCAEDAGVTDCFIFEGNQPNPYPYMANADLFVHPSYVESQGLVVLEAMALGVPCVVTKSLGPCEFIEDGVNGILTEQSAESLAEKVELMLTDRALYERIKANTRCPEQFAPEHVMQKIDKLLEEK